MSVLTFDHVGLTYGADTAPVLQDVSLEVGSSEIVVLVGASGSGKTSLLKLAAGFQRPTTGRVLRDGLPLRGAGADRAVVFQDDALFPWLSARDNVAFALRLKRMAKRRRHARAEEALELVGLAGLGDRAIWKLSGGQRQRVGLARALVADPAFLLMDEPFGALDALTRQTMQLALIELWGRTGKGILFITHDVEEALLLATRLVVLGARPGRVVDDLALDFSRRLAAGEAVRQVRSDAAFVALRERVLDQLFERAAA